MTVSSSTIPEELTALVKQSVIATIESLCGAEAACHSEGHPETPCDGLCGIISFIGDFGWCWKPECDCPRREYSPFTSRTNPKRRSGI